MRCRVRCFVQDTQTLAVSVNLVTYNTPVPLA
jgi:hypothetical protein